MTGERNDTAGVTLFLVDPKAKGVAMERTIMVDAHNAARIEFDNVEIDADHVLGEVDQGFALLEGVLNIGRGAVASVRVQTREVGLCAQARCEDRLAPEPGGLELIAVGAFEIQEGPIARPG